MFNSAKIIVAALGAILGCWLPGSLLGADEVDATFSRTVMLPIDHQNPESGNFAAYVEFGARFDPLKPTVLVVNDGQQFFVRRGAMTALQEQLFGDGMNVVGIVGRGALQDNPELLQRIQPESGNTDWLMAWQLLRAYQWVEDIETVRRALLGDVGRIMLFGRSGGGLLVHEYLARHGDHVARAFTSAPASSASSALLGLQFDTFWEEMDSGDGQIHHRIRAVMRSGRVDRLSLATAFQRQNFFVPAARIAEARLQLLATFENGSDAELQDVLAEYQVSAMQQFNNSVRAIPSRVRLFEFALPYLESWQMQDDRLDPDIEVILASSAPLRALAEHGQLDLTAATLDHRLLHDVAAELFVMVGRWDHVVDYRGSIALAASYPNAGIYIADDNHTFQKMNEAGIYQDILQAFLLHGRESAAFAEVAADSEAYRWRLE